MDQGIVKLLELLGIEDQAVSEYAKLINLEVDPTTDSWFFLIEFERPIPILRYRNFITKLLSIPSINPAVKHIDYQMSVKDFSNDDLMDYYDYVIDVLVEEDRRVMPLKDYLTDINNGKIKIKVPSGAISASMFRKEIETELMKNGIKATVDIQIDETSKPIVEEIEKINRVFVASNESITPSAQIRYTQLYEDKPVDNDFFPLQKIPFDELELEEYKAKNGNKANFTVRGTAVTVEIRQLRTFSQANIIISDQNDSILIKKRISSAEELRFCKDIHEGTGVIAHGFAVYEPFYGEIIINAVSLAKSTDLIPKDLRTDDATEKRVELHLHTKMSSLDGVNSMDDFVTRARAWGHLGIGVSDHGSVQAFPDLFHAVKDTGIKGLYGLELVYADDLNVTITRGQSSSMLNDATYVVFDIETTGLSVVYDTLIEIAAIKIKSGTIIGEYSTFINPKRQISEFTTNLTGIANSDVINAPDIDSVLREFLKFSSESILVAHNADFDIGHINYHFQKLGIDATNQPSIDTLVLAKAIYPDRQRYSLDQLCKLLKVPLNGHHRAINDAKATAEIFLHMLKELKKQGINRFIDINRIIDRNKVHKYPYPNHINLLVKKQEGLKNLYKILSEASTTYFDRDPKITRSYLERHRKGLFVSSGCRNSNFFEVAMNKTRDDLVEAAKFYDYLEVQPLSTFSYLKNSMSNWATVIQDVIKKIVEVGHELTIPVCATGDVHHLDMDDKKYREIMIANPQVGGGFHKLHNEIEKPSQHFMTTEEMMEEFRFLGEETAYEIVVKNPNMIMDQCDSIEIFGKELFAPTDEFLAEQGVPSIKNKVETMVREKARKVYGNPLPGIVSTRLEKELGSIIKNKFSTIYFISHLLVKKSNDDGYLVGSRGSVGSSLVATLMDITEVNPLPPHYICPKCQFSAFKKTEEEKKLYGSNDFEIRNQHLLDHSDCGWDLPTQECPICGTQLIKNGHDIPFETFLGFKGDKVPDIDLNFSGDYQGKVHEYIRKLFGENYAFRAGTIGTCAAKTAFGMVRDYYKKINESLEQHDQAPVKIRRAEMERLAKGIEGSKRTSGQHPGGIVVVPNNKEIYDVTPIQYPGDSSDTNWKTTHFDYHSFENNLFKLDVLGHDDPTVIRYLMDFVKNEPLEFPFSKAQDIPIDDKNVYRLLSGTEVLELSPDDIRTEIASYGIPEFGTNFVRGMLKDSRPQNFAELVKISGLSHGTNVWNSNAQDLISGRRKDFGRIDFKDIIGCRDDIMIDLIKYGMQPTMAFEIMEFVRKGKAPVMPDKWSSYADLMRQAGVPEWYIWSCSKIEYMFPKAHATAYVMMAMRIAWFKLYKPIYFYSAYFSKRAAIYDVDAFLGGETGIKNRLDAINSSGNDASERDLNLVTVLELALEMYKRGLTFSPVDIHLSDAADFLISPDHQSLIMPFVVVDSLGKNVAASIIEARHEKPFLSKQDVRNRTKISKTLFDKLDDIGAFKDLVEESQMSLFDM
ncbi:MAG: PolC-type DNA polymerase III [Candidatus Izemoplasmatales bacterium]|nr:PolC-type DNA polymerase III [Candidatus Izemoplasmatales bacterium]